MSQPDLQNMTDQPNTWHMLRAMGGVGILCAVLIVFTFQATLPAIETNKAAALEKAIFAVIPGASTKIAFKLNENKQFEEVEKAEKGVRVVYAGYNDQNELVGVAIEANGQGFQDIIRVIYGYSPESQAIIGFQVLESKETPGLGDKIEKDADFLKNFEALDVSVMDDFSAVKNPVEWVKKGEKTNPWQVDNITGATISSKAIANLLRNNTGEIIPLLVQNIKTLKNAKTATDLSAVQH